MGRRIPIRISILLPHLSLSGGTKIPLMYADGLSRRGHAVTLICGQPPTPPLRTRLKNLLARRGTDSVHHPRGNVSVIHTARRGQSVVEDLPDADILIGTWWETVEAMASAPPSKGRQVYFVQGHEAYSYMPLDRVTATYTRPIHKIVVSQWLEQLMRAEYGATSLTCIPNPVDLTQFRYEPRDWSPTARIGTVFSMAPMKNSALALDGVRIARERLPGLHLVTFGPDKPPAMAFEGGWFQNRLRPDQSEIPEIYRQCDYWLWTSTTEGFGLPILEAMAVGTPVIATSAGASPQLVTPQTGALVGNDAGEMAQAILRLAKQSPEEWKAMSAACRSMADLHGLEPAVLKMEATLGSLLAD